MIKTVITCDRCGLVMASVETCGPQAEDRLVELAESCGHSIDGEDICRECKKMRALEKGSSADEVVSDEAVTRKIVVPAGLRKKRSFSEPDSR